MGHGIHLPYPKDVFLPTCDCGEFYLSGEAADMIEARLRQPYLVALTEIMDRDIRALKKAGFDSRQISAACEIDHDTVSCIYREGLGVRSSEQQMRNIEKIDRRSMRLLHLYARHIDDMRDFVDRKAWDSSEEPGG